MDSNGRYMKIDRWRIKIKLGESAGECIMETSCYTLIFNPMLSGTAEQGRLGALYSPPTFWQRMALFLLAKF